jgi:mediator of RNA polymerase II transcription subunit 14
MPGVIMENGSRNGSHTNHDRDVRPNGINGGVHTSEKTQEKSKPKAEPQQNMTPTSPFAPTGLNGNFTTDALRQEGEGKTIAREAEDRSFQLPPEINHITQGYIGLKDLLSRMAQKTHSDLIGTITELSQMPLPASATNGNTSHSNAPDDNSLENVNKKVRLLQFLETAHDSWTKALVIAGWSRRAEEVSKIIDLHVHLNLQKQLYLNILGRMGDDKKELMAARMLNPDLRTALEVLTTGKASWMPDVSSIYSYLGTLLI